jgi:hypothetical protein
MSDWVVVPCLLKLRSEINALAPRRDKGADGTIGDSAHTSSSDHTPDEDSDVLRDHDADSKNEVHALDIDVDLNQPGLSLEKVVQHLLKRARAGDRRLRYVIFNRRIWSASSGWQQKAYGGKDPHTNHAHFSASYETAQEARTDSWLEGLADMPITEDEFDKIEARAKAAAKAAVTEVLSAENPRGGGSPFGALTTILARTGSIANVQLPAVATAIAGIDTGQFTPEDIDALAVKLTEALDDEFAGVLLDKLKGRLES